jgi:two-component system, sensor histidine kinase
MRAALRAMVNDDPLAALTRERDKLLRINAVLMDRVERSTDLQGNAFSIFETAIALEGKVRLRTTDLETALAELAKTNAALAGAKEAADDAQQRLRDAIESINEGFAIFDAEDRLVLCNQTYLGLWPNVADQIIPGMRFDEIARLVGDNRTTLGAIVAPEQWISERMAQHRIAEGGHVHALADGRWIQINELRTSEGGIVGVYTDITEVKAKDARERTRELAEKSAVLQATLDNIRLGVCVYDAGRRLIGWNGPLLETIGLPADGIALIDTHDGMIETCGRANGPMGANAPLAWLARGSNDSVTQRRHASGRVLEIRRSLLPDGGMVMSFEDITDRLNAANALRETAENLERRVQERTREMASVNAKLQQEITERLAAEAALLEAKTVAEQANSSKTHFLAAASHDLLQPLNAARLFVAALGDRRLALPTRALVQQTGSALDSVEDLLEALLEISRLDAGAIAVECSDFPVCELLDAMKAEFSPMAAKRGLEFEICGPLAWVHSDPRLLRRILQNFIANALRYTPAGSVHVVCSLAQGALQIDVIDTGIGIAPEHQGMIFEEFKRIDKNAGSRGMGLGLAIVQRASRILDHPISLASALGKGSRFGVMVPLGTARNIDAIKAPVARRGALAGQAVLVIDNEPNILDAMRAVLEGWGCTVTVATSEREAMARMDQSGTIPDVILADYHLGGIWTGDVAIKSIQAYLAKSIASAVITADRTPELRERLIRDGLPVLTKPVKPAQLRAFLSSVRL